VLAEAVAKPYNPAKLAEEEGEDDDEEDFGPGE
jgi:hypothetical protein